MIVIVGVLKVWPRFKGGLMEFVCFAFVHAESSNTCLSTDLDIQGNFDVSMAHTRKTSTIAHYTDQKKKKRTSGNECDL